MSKNTIKTTYNAMKELWHSEYAQKIHTSFYRKNSKNLKKSIDISFIMS